MKKYPALLRVQVILDTYLEEGATYAELENEIRKALYSTLETVKILALDAPEVAIAHSKQLETYIQALAELKGVGE